MGFFEILIIAIVALLVVGPERMPEAIRTVAITIGRIKRSFNSARDEIEKHVGADDIRRQLHNEAIMESLEKAKEGISDIENSIHDDEDDEDDIENWIHHGDDDEHLPNKERHAQRTQKENQEAPTPNTNH